MKDRSKLHQSGILDHVPGTSCWNTSDMSVEIACECLIESDIIFVFDAEVAHSKRVLTPNRAMWPGFRFVSFSSTFAFVTFAGLRIYHLRECGAEDHCPNTPKEIYNLLHSRKGVSRVEVTIVQRKSRFKILSQYVAGSAIMIGKHTHAYTILYNSTQRGVPLMRANG